MTRKSRREIERAIEQLRGGDGPDDIDVTSEVLEITADDVDENGALVDVPDPEVPDDHHALRELPADSDAVTVYEGIELEDPDR